MDKKDETNADRLGNMLLHVELLATRSLLAKIIAELFALSGAPAAKAEEWVRFYEQVANQITFPGETPEWSDIASQEFRDVIMLTLQLARAQALRASPDGSPHNTAIGAPKARSCPENE